MKKRTTLLALTTLLSAGLVLQAQKLTRPLLSHLPIAPEHIATTPLATPDATDKTGRQWGKYVNKVYQDGQWVISNEKYRTFDENDRSATSTSLYYQ